MVLVRYFFYFLILLLAFSNLLIAQGRAGGDRPAPKLLKGIVVDEVSKKPLEYATVSAFKQKDSVLVDGVITNMSGAFELKLRPGKYFLKVQYISYQDKNVEGIFLNREVASKDLGKIEMSADAETLDEVVVSGQKGQMVLELDKRVFNVSENLSNVGSNASEIMDNLPSVSVDVEGSVSLRGSENVKILVNGKPSGLVGINDTNGLRQLQGNLIERIEVITNPSARYDAEGSAGIINIILKKERQKGFNGSFTANAGIPASYGLSGSVNYRTGNLNLFGSYGVNYRENLGGGYTLRRSYRTDTLLTRTNNDRNRADQSHTIRLGMDYYINEKNILTASGMFKISDEENVTDIDYNDMDINENLFSRTSRRDFEIEDDNNKEFQLSYNRLFEGEGHELKIDVQYRDNDETEQSNIDSANLFVSPQNYNFQRSSNIQGDKNILTQVDYINPISKGKKIEAGYRGTIREISSDYLVEQVDGEMAWSPLANFSNQFIYNEDVYAFYGIFENKKEVWGYQIGLRFEQTFISTFQRETNETNEKRYFNAFPSAFLSYKVNKKQSFQASYSRRLSRPRFWLLNPFFSFSDPRNIRTGNTNLNPEYTDAYEIGSLYNLEKASLYFGGYFRYTTGDINRVKTSEDGFTTVSSPHNIGTSKAFGIEANFNIDPLKWLSINGNANFYRAISDGRYNDIILDRDTYSARFRLNNKFKIGKANLQVSGFYRAPEENTQGTRKAMYAMDLGSNFDVFKGNGTLTFFVKDVFNTRRWRGTTEGENFDEESEFQWRSRQGGVSFTYRINQKKSRSRGGRGDGGDMEGGEF